MGIGDEIMVSGAARVMQRNDPRKIHVRHGMKHMFSEVWRCNPRIRQPGEDGDFQTLYARDPVTNMRPYHKRKTDEKWVYELSFRPEIGEIYLTDAEWDFGKRFSPDIIIEPHIKSGASPNKQYGRAGWEEIVRLLKLEGRHVAQMGGIGTRPIQGTEMIMTPSFRCAVAVMARAKGMVLPDGGLHHAAAAINKPAVVLMGGFTPVELTGYPMHRNLGASLDEACGIRNKRCPHCDAIFAKIEPEFVVQQLKEVISEHRTKNV